MKKSKKQLQEKVLAELANGELVTALCRRDDMPPYLPYRDGGGWILSLMTDAGLPKRKA